MEGPAGPEPVPSREDLQAGRPSHLSEAEAGGAAPNLLPSYDVGALLSGHNRGNRHTVCLYKAEALTQGWKPRALGTSPLANGSPVHDQ